VGGIGLANPALRQSSSLRGPGHSRHHGGRIKSGMTAGAAMMLAACSPETPAQPPVPGEKLEAAATAAGLVVDPATAPIAGSWARDNQRMCVVPAGDALRVGALLDYGDGQGCAASGTAERRGERLRVRFGDCRFEARFDGERIAFPAALPDACATLCTGRASLAAFAVDRLSTSISEAATLRAPSGQGLCAD
jgi:hypothetical protein